MKMGSSNWIILSLVAALASTTTSTSIEEWTILQKSLAGLNPTTGILNAISGPLTKLLLGAIYRNQDVLSGLKVGTNDIGISSPWNICLNMTPTPEITIPIDAELLIELTYEMLSDIQITLTNIDRATVWLDYGASTLVVGLDMSAPLFRMTGDFNWTTVVTNKTDSNVTFTSLIVEESDWTIDELHFLLSLGLGPLVPMNSTLQVSNFDFAAREKNMTWPTYVTVVNHTGTVWGPRNYTDFTPGFHDFMDELWNGSELGQGLSALVQLGLNILLRNCTLKDVLETGLECMNSSQLYQHPDLPEGLAMYDAMVTFLGQNECPPYQAPTTTTTTTTTPGTGETTTTTTTAAATTTTAAATTTTAAATTTTTPTTTTPPTTTPNSAQILTFWSFLPFVSLLVYGASA